VEETKWMFEDLKSQIPWQEKNIKVQGKHIQPNEKLLRKITNGSGNFKLAYMEITLHA
jgi:hypothetical protein